MVCGWEGVGCESERQASERARVAGDGVGSVAEDAPATHTLSTTDAALPLPPGGAGSAPAGMLSVGREDLFFARARATERERAREALWREKKTERARKRFGFEWFCPADSIT